jgi:hypothetical protein
MSLKIHFMSLQTLYVTAETLYVTADTFCHWRDTLCHCSDTLCHCRQFMSLQTLVNADPLMSLQWHVTRVSLQTIYVTARHFMSLQNTLCHCKTLYVTASHFTSLQTNLHKCARKIFNSNLCALFLNYQFSVPCLLWSPIWNKFHPEKKR